MVTPGSSPGGPVYETPSNNVGGRQSNSGKNFNKEPRYI